MWVEIIPDTDLKYIEQIGQSDEAAFDSLFALFVACLGLLGLSAFAAEQKMKEIGIRKVFGATAQGLVVKLSAEFTRWVGRFFFYPR